MADHDAGCRGGIVPARVSLVPLRDLVTMGPLGIVGNLLVFASLGFFAPMRFAALASVPRILALGAGCSVLVETAQYVLRLDRVSSVDDVLVNAAGAALAALASRRWWRTTAEAPSDQPRPRWHRQAESRDRCAHVVAYVGDMLCCLGSRHARTDRGGRALPGRSRP